MKFNLPTRQHPQAGASDRSRSKPWRRGSHCQKWCHWSIYGVTNYYCPTSSRSLSAFPSCEIIALTLAPSALTINNYIPQQKQRANIRKYWAYLQMRYALREAKDSLASRCTAQIDCRHTWAWSTWGCSCLYCFQLCVFLLCLIKCSKYWIDLRRQFGTRVTQAHLDRHFALLFLSIYFYVDCRVCGISFLPRAWMNVP